MSGSSLLIYHAARRKDSKSALKIDDDVDLQKLLSNGWNVISQSGQPTFRAYPDYIRRSRGVGRYRKINTRGFGRDGSVIARLLTWQAASPSSRRRPVSKTLPTGRGLFQFSTMNEILAAIDAINSDYRAHCHAAREIASEYFDARKVASALLKEISREKRRMWRYSSLSMREFATAFRSAATDKAAHRQVLPLYIIKILPVRHVNRQNDSGFKSSHITTERFIII